MDTTGNQVAILRRTVSKYRKYLELISFLHPKSRLLAKQTSRIIRISGTDHHYISQVNVERQP